MAVSKGKPKASSVKSDMAGAFRDWSVPRQLAGEDPLGTASRVSPV